MKINKFKKIMIITIMLLSLNFLYISLNNNNDFVKASYYNFYGFEDSVLTHQVTCDESGMFYTESACGEVRDLSSYSGDNSYFIEESGEQGTTYFNFGLNCIERSDIMESFTMWVNVTDNNSDMYFYFENTSSDTTIIKLKYEVDGVKYFNYLDGDLWIGNSTSVGYGNWIKIKWIYYNNETVNYTIQRSGYDNIRVTGTPNNILDDYYTVDRLKIITEDSKPINIDDISVSWDSEFQEEEELQTNPTISDINVYTNGALGIFDVKRDSSVDYKLEINGDIGSSATIEILKPDDSIYYTRQINLFTVDSLTLPFNVYYDISHPVGEWTFTIYDNYDNENPYYYIEQVFDLWDNFDIVTNYTEIFGDYFVEFENYDKECYYSIGDKSTILWRLRYNDTFTYSNETKMYVGRIIYNSEAVSDFWIDIDTTYDEYDFGKKNIGYEFPYLGDYYIIVYTTKIENKMIVMDEKIYTSNVITICDDSPWDENTDILPGGVNKNDELAGITIQTWYVIIAIAICIIMVILPFLIAKNWRNKIPKEVGYISGLFGVCAFTFVNIFPLWLPFSIVLLIIAFIIIKIKKL